MSSQPTRTGRRGGIPLNLVNNWQCPGTRNQQVLVRRPITACEPCRAAKVKCDGQYDCGRCTSRGLDCRYAPSAKAVAAQPTPPNVSSSSPVEMPLRSDDSAVESPLVEMAIDKPSDTSSTQWAKDIGYQSPELFDWNNLDLGLIDDTVGSQGNSNMDEAHFSPSGSALTGTTTKEFSSILQNDMERGTMSTYLTWSQSPLEMLSSKPCQCRLSLVLHMSRVQDVMKERPKPMVDKVFGVTRDIIKDCKDILDCNGCQVNSADLIWIMAVFQQTGSCFEYILNIDFGHYVKVGVGEYEVLMPNESSSLGRILVMDLVKQADALLMALANLGQTITVANTLLNPLNQVNLEYIQEVIKSFRLIFQRIENKD